MPSPFVFDQPITALLITRALNFGAIYYRSGRAIVVRLYVFETPRSYRDTPNIGMKVSAGNMAPFPKFATIWIS